MEWSRQQEEALRRVAEWYRARSKPYFCLAGFAGTGKTTLARHLAEGFSDVYFAAYTGKAALVLRRRGVPSATTIHRLIYTPKDKCDDHLRQLRLEKVRLLRRTPRPDFEIVVVDGAIRAEQQNLSRPDFHLNLDSPLNHASLVVVDEYSMVDEVMGPDLLSFGCPVLALGDPGQLPPVQGRCFFSSDPDYLLTEVHRQAADNPVLHLATMARQGEPIPLGSYGESRVVRRPADLSDARDALLGADQVLVGTNKTRRSYNATMRKWKGHLRDLPVVGDKLVCLRNNYEDGLLNGQTFEVEHVNLREYLELRLCGDEGEVVRCRAHRKYFEEVGSVEFDPRERRLASELDYGYAITVHKSQGSEWGRVALVDEWRGQGRREWLYTAITRAAESITMYC